MIQLDDNNKASIKKNKFENPKRSSQVINQKRTENSVGKRKGTKIQTMADKILHRKLKIKPQKQG